MSARSSRSPSSSASSDRGSSSTATISATAAADRALAARVSFTNSSLSSDRAYSAGWPARAGSCRRAYGSARPGRSARSGIGHRCACVRCTSQGQISAAMSFAVSSFIAGYPMHRKIAHTRPRAAPLWIPMHDVITFYAGGKGGRLGRFGGAFDILRIIRFQVLTC